jgi:hypothetical protein
LINETYFEGSEKTFRVEFVSGWMKRNVMVKEAKGQARSLSRKGGNTINY